MNDLDMLRDGWDAPPAPRDDARSAARAALLERAAGARTGPVAVPAKTRRGLRLPRMGVRLAAVGVLAAAIAAGVTVVQTSGGTDEHSRPRSVLPGVPAGPVANASELLERAAVAAEGRPFTPPRPDQWIYTEFRGRSGPTPNGPLYKDPSKVRVTRSWQRADGKQAANLRHGKIEILGMMPTTPPSDYPTLAALPTDPQALLQRVYKDMGGLGETAEGRYATAYTMLGAVLRDQVLPPKVIATIYRAIKLIPGVTLAKGVDAAGRPALAVGRVAEGWLSQQLMLDPKTYSYLGERSIAIKNHTSRGDDGSVTSKKGDLLNLSARMQAAIVDKPGQRP
jgi:hypothetical protein